MQHLLLSFSLLATYSLTAQTISWEYLAPLPEKITNNAVTGLTQGEEYYLYSFSGIDSTLDCSGDHLRAYRYTLSTDSWETLADIPDALGGKIAAGANVIKDKVYVVGGYHLSPSCGEVSSAKIHIFDPLSNSYLIDGADIPVAIDDQVQAVWRDSLLYVVSGWSNTANVSNVQVYNPAADSWAQATPVPSNSNWRVFGGSGSIVGDTIYYSGGARSTSGFTPTIQFRKGAINPDNPLEITWSDEIAPISKGYRMGAATYEGQPIWIGGSSVTYNFDAVAYNGSGLVSPLDRILVYDPTSGELNELLGFIPAVMDFRGVAELGNGEYLLAGGMGANQSVSNQLLHITIDELTSTPWLLPNGQSVEYFPNPTQDEIQLQFSAGLDADFSWKLVNAQGQAVQQGVGQSKDNWRLSLSGLAPASYWLQLQWADGSGRVLPISKL